MKLNKKEVAQNLRLFGYRKYGSMKKFAEALDMNPSTLYSGYLNGRSLPGPVLLVKLIDLGCDINWLLTGRGADPTTQTDTGAAPNLPNQQRRERSSDNGVSQKSSDVHHHPQR